MDMLFNVKSKTIETKASFVMFHAFKPRTHRTYADEVMSKESVVKCVVV